MKTEFFLNKIENELNDIHNVIFGENPSKQELINIETNLNNIYDKLIFLNKILSISNNQINKIIKLFIILFYTLLFLIICLCIIGSLNLFSTILLYLLIKNIIKKLKIELNYKSKNEEKITELLKNTEYKQKIIKRKIKRLSDLSPKINSNDYPSYIPKLIIPPRKLVLKKDE